MNFSKLVIKNFRSPPTNFFVMECWSAPDLSQTWTSRLAGLDIARPEPDQTIDYYDTGSTFHSVN